MLWSVNTTLLRDNWMLFGGTVSIEKQKGTSERNLRRYDRIFILKPSSSCPNLTDILLLNRTTTHTHSFWVFSCDTRNGWDWTELRAGRLEKWIEIQIYDNDLLSNPYQNQRDKLNWSNSTTDYRILHDKLK